MRDNPITIRLLPTLCVVLSFFSVQLLAQLTSDDVETLLKSGFSSEEIQKRIVEKGYAAGGDDATLQRLRRAGADADLILLLAKIRDIKRTIVELRTPTIDFCSREIAAHWILYETKLSDPEKARRITRIAEHIQDRVATAYDKAAYR